MERGDFHGFPESVTAFGGAGTVTEIVGGDGVVRQILQIPGNYRGVDGVFEFIKDAQGWINHRFFNAR